MNGEHSSTPVVETLHNGSQTKISVGDELTNVRKIEHIKAFDSDSDIDRKLHAFDSIKLTHKALPNLNLKEIDTSCEFLGKKLTFPLLISSMTGGDHELVERINKNLALAAEHCGVAMGVGSQRVMFTNPKAAKSFELRKYAPTTVLLANVGAVQLNYGFTQKQCQSAVDVLQADGLYLHLNPLQEAVQPEGDVDFSNLHGKISSLVESVDVPVLFKEVGSGLSLEDIQAGLDMGVKYFDVAGGGGTSWSRIEYHRRNQENDNLGLVFQDWAIPTPESLAQGYRYLSENGIDATMIASGGIRNGIDMAKAVILGASLCGIAAPLLKPAMQSVEETIEAIERLKKEFTTAMFLMGVQNVKGLTGNTQLIRKPFVL